MYTTLAFSFVKYTFMISCMHITPNYMPAIIKKYNYVHFGGGRLGITT